MKRSNNAFLTLFIAGLFYSPTQAQSVAETPQFNFPLEVGNVWAYHLLPGCDISPNGCAFERWEIIRTHSFQADSTCVEFEVRKEKLITNGNDVDVQTSHSERYMCVAGNLVYWKYSGNGQPPNDTMLKIADFDADEGEKWTIWEYENDVPMFWLRRVDFKSEEQPFQWYFLDYTAESEDEDFVDNTSGNAFTPIPWGFTDGIGITGLGYYSFRGSLIDGVLSGDTISFTQRFLTDIELHLEERSERPSLLRAYPNPFNPSTVIRWTMDVGRETKLSVYDLLGREVAVLVNERMPAGQHSVTFDASGLPSGMYVIVLETAGFRDARKITLLK